LQGGIATYIKNFSESLAKAGHEVVVFGVPSLVENRPKIFIVNGVKII